MKTYLTASLLCFGLATGALHAQCCNVIASNGTTVTTDNGACVTLAYSTSDCPTSVPLDSDTDGDGVKDEVDKCPYMKGLPENKGCPVVTRETWVLFYTHLRDVRFATASDSITKSSTSKLDKVARLMQDNKDYILKVSGYADSVGTYEYNKELSQKRAVAVKKYLVAKGVPSKKVVVAAFGEKFPEAPNETPEGRSVNRRVEFDLFY